MGWSRVPGTASPSPIVVVAVIASNVGSQAGMAEGSVGVAALGPAFGLYGSGVFEVSSSMHRAAKHG